MPKSFVLVVFPSPTTISGSSIVKDAEFIVVVVPLTVKFPPNVRVFVDGLYVKSVSVFG